MKREIDTAKRIPHGRGTIISQQWLPGGALLVIVEHKSTQGRPLFRHYITVLPVEDLDAIGVRQEEE